MKEPRRDLNLWKVTYVSIWVNLILAIIKIWFGVISGSRALIADGMHSLFDLASDFAVIIGLKISAKPSDENHHFGHHRYSTLAQFSIALLLTCISSALVYNSVQRLQTGTGVSPPIFVIIAAGISLIVKEWLFKWTLRVSRKYKSRLIEANAWHHRSDSLSSLLVFVGLFVMLIGGETWAFIDSVTGIALGSVLVFQGLRQMKQAINDLMDAAPKHEIIEDLREHILRSEGAIAYHDFRVRSQGDFFEIDMHLQVDSGLTVGEGHAIAKRVKTSICSKHPEVLNVLIHVEPASGEHIKARGISDKSEPVK